MEPFMITMDNFTFMVPWMMALLVLIYYLIARRTPKDKRAKLFYSIIHKGCQNCGSDFRVIHMNLSDRGPMHVECTKCDKQYRIDHILKQAWEVNRSTEQ